MPLHAHSLSIVISFCHDDIVLRHSLKKEVEVFDMLRYTYVAKQPGAAPIIFLVYCSQRRTLCCTCLSLVSHCIIGTH